MVALRSFTTFQVRQVAGNMAGIICVLFSLSKLITVYRHRHITCMGTGIYIFVNSLAFYPARLRVHEYLVNVCVQRFYMICPVIPTCVLISPKAFIVIPCAQAQSFSPPRRA